MLLEHYLKQLKLPTILREYAAVAAACTQDRSDYATYLLRLVEREVIEREHRAAERRIKAAGFPVIKTLDTFDFAAQPSINEALVRELMQGRLYRQPRECPAGGQQRHGQDAPGLRVGVRRLRPGPAGAVLHRDRAGDHSCWSSARSGRWSGCSGSWSGWTCWCWTSWGTCRSRRPERRCCSRW